MKAALLGFLLIILLALFATGAGAEGNDEFIAIAYHDVVKNKTELASDAVTLDHLIDQFEWLLANNYHPISIDDLLAAKSGKKPLPEKPVLLSWDDGYTSFYTLVFPLLKAYHFPAVLALQGSWIEPRASSKVLYGNNLVSRDKFLTWKQLQELAKSPLVEIASHSYDLHHGVLADGFGDKLPAAIAHIYDPTTKTYEKDNEQFDRIFHDLQKNSALIQKHLGKTPRVMVWPFGRYTKAALKAAAQAGMDITLTLNPVPGDISNLQEIGRVYPTLNPDLSDYRGYLNPDIPPPIRHFFKVSSKDLLDPLPTTEKRFSLLLDRLKSLTPSMVSFAPIIRNSKGIQALFPNSVVPLAQDRLSRWTWHATHRGGTGTFLWLPSILFASETSQQPAINNTFFEEMGKAAFCEGVLVNSPLLLDNLLRMRSSVTVTDSFIRSWNPARRKMFRQQLLETSTEPGIIGSLEKLNALQEWQPFIEIALVLPLDRLPELTTRKTVFLLQYFDFLLLDARNDTKKNIEKTVKTSLGQLHSSELLSKISLLVKRTGDGLPSLFADLPRYNIINWGYEYDGFLDNRPTTISIRPFISNSSEPFQ